MYIYIYVYTEHMLFATSRAFVGGRRPPHGAAAAAGAQTGGGQQMEQSTADEVPFMRDLHV